MLGHVQNHYDTVFSGYSPGNTALELNMLGTSPKRTPGHVYLKECTLKLSQIKGLLCKMGPYIPYG